MINKSKALLNDFALRCFRTTADRDYVHARLAYRSRLFPQFHWSSLHCLEKYAKCILLLNRIDGRKFKHEVRKPINKVNKNAKFEVKLSKPSWTFIDSLEFGARFRYLEVSWHNTGHDIVALDRAVFELRRYCQVLDHSIKVKGKTINVLHENIERVEKASPPWKLSDKLCQGWLEQIEAKRDHPARSALVWNNLWFCASRRKNVKLMRRFESENSPLYLHPEIIDEVTNYVFLPKEIIEGYKNNG